MSLCIYLLGYSKKATEIGGRKFDTQLWLQIRLVLGMSVPKDIECSEPDPQILDPSGNVLNILLCEITMEVRIMEEVKVRSERKRNQADRLLIILLIYCSASLIHFIHNAEFIDEYPNLPEWISAAGVYISWLGITSIGLTGYFLLRYGKRFIGLLIVAVYAGIGFDGLGHYSLAPMSAHTLAMNVTIWMEAITAAIVLIAVVGLMVNDYRVRSWKGLACMTVVGEPHDLEADESRFFCV